MKKIALFFLFGLVFSLSSCAKNGEEKVSIMVARSSAYSIASSNPLSLHPGEDFSFKLDINDDYKFISCELGASYEEGILSGKVPNYSLTLHPVFLPTGQFEIKINSSSSLSSVQTTYVKHDDKPLGTIIEGDTLRLTPVVASSERFIGYSKDDFLSNYGSLYIAAPILEYKVTESLTLYANFEKKNDLTHTIFYDPNGGVTKGGFDNDSLVAVSTYTPHIQPNSLNYLEAPFSKEGSLLVGYNTQKDGSGKMIHLGSRIDPSLVISNTLYCIYKPYDDVSLFKYEEEDGKLAITSCSSSNKEIVIPSSINGKIVTKIKTGALNNLPVESLVLPPTIEYMESNAVKACPNLTTLTMYDNITDIKDAGVKDNLITLYINAAMAPRYSLDEPICFADELPIIEKMDPTKPRLILTGDSSTRYSFYTENIVKAYPNYSVFNFGNSACMTDFFYVRLLSTYLKKGDIVFWGTNNHLFSENCYFERASTTDWVLMFSESNYDLLSRLDCRLFTERFLGDFYYVNSQRNALKPLAYTSYNPNGWKSTQYGDFDCYRDDKDNDDYLKDKQDYKANVSFLNEKRVPRLKAFKEEMNEKGVGLYMIGFPICANFIDSTVYNNEFFINFYNALEEKTGIKMVSNEFSYIMAPHLFYNSEYHTSTHGCILRTEHFLSDIKSVMPQAS